MTDDAIPIPALTVNITSGEVPAAGACTGCSTWTDTGLGVWGDPDWCFDVLSRFMFRSDVDAAITEAALREHGLPPEEVLEMGFGVRLCLNCAHRAELVVRTFAEGEGVAMYPQPGTLPPGGLATLS